ncbi:hypothetical protein [Dethiobacter alkaliphilus]|uniref:hypothetical protein n=1 Tax=Dethiobacter alkaliphilus TaxID=427926 RepID=UPI002227072A|nr:hypothetical protein [Dethiobacter alkaliphilus]MCW3490586.1 hypothetical protein [Dethiobacter alkaliphilus]
MYRLRVLDAKAVHTEGLMEMIVELDKYSDQPFTKQISQTTVSADEVYILVLTEDDRLAGYLQCGPLGKDSEHCGSSMKIDRRQGQSILISQLLLRAKKDLLRYGYSYAH